MKFIALAAIPAAALILVGCASAAPASTTTSPEPASAAPASSAPVDEPSASEAAPVEQWASVIARAQSDLEEVLDELDAEQCTAPLAASPDGMLCRAQLLAATWSADTLRLNLSGPTNPAATTFIADEPPTEIARLWERTAEAATAAADAGAAWSDADCGFEPGGDCLFLGSDFEQAMSALDTEFAGWAPYL